jgi:subtilisin family serine protease
MCCRAVALALISLGLTACTQPHLPSVQLRQMAPTKPTELGVLLQQITPSEIAQITSAHPHANLRIVSAAHGLYEIHGVDNNELKRSFGPRAQLNRWITRQAAQPQSPSALVFAEHQPCPEAKLTVKGKQQLNETLAIELMTPQQNFILRIVPSPLSAQTVLSAEHGPQTNTSTPLKIDALGLYKIFVFSERGEDVCLSTATEFIVTANPQWHSTDQQAAPVPGAEVALADFTHLEQIRAKQAWAKSLASSGPLTAIIDTGIHYNHPEFANVIQELGYDFVNGDQFPFDDDGHGTHVAGLIAARSFGVAKHAKILPIKAFSSLGGDIGSVAGAIFYAVDHGAKLINVSAGITDPAAAEPLQYALDYAHAQGVLVVIAAGNGDSSTGFGFDIDENPVYPASLANPNTIVVAASDQENLISPYSNYGRTHVDLVAPGGFLPAGLLSTSAENARGELYHRDSGTSMAAPLVTGTAALAWATRPEATAQMIKHSVMCSGPKDMELQQYTTTGRQLDALATIEAIGSLDLRQSLDQCPAP